MRVKPDTDSRKKMPLQREHLQFAVLFLCVPIQYLAVEFMGSSEVSRTYAISQLVRLLGLIQRKKES